MKLRHNSLLMQFHSVMSIYIHRVKQLENITEHQPSLQLDLQPRS